jgi:hypothetical protein
MAHYIYLVGNPQLNWFKIGRTTNYANRLKSIQHGLPFPVVELHHHEVPSFEFSSALESDLGNWYAPINIRGEWYMDINFAEFPTIVQTLSDNLQTEKRKIVRRMRVMPGRLVPHNDPLVHRNVRGHLGYPRHP